MTFSISRINVSKNSIELTELLGKECEYQNSDFRAELNKEALKIGAISDTFYEQFVKDAQSRISSAKRIVALKNGVFGTAKEILNFGADGLEMLVTDFSKYSFLPKILMKGLSKTFQNLTNLAAESYYKLNREVLDTIVAKEVNFVAAAANLAGFVPGKIKYSDIETLYKKLGIEHEDLGVANKVIMGRIHHKVRKMERFLGTRASKEELEKHKKTTRESIKKFEEGIVSQLKDVSEFILRTHTEAMELIEKISNDVKNNKEAIKVLAHNQIEQRKLLYESAFKLAAIEAFHNFERGTLENQIKDLESGKLDLFISNKNEMLKDLKDLKFKKDIILISDTIAQVAQITSMALKTFDLLKGKDLERTSEALQYAEKIALAMSNYVACNYAGMVMNILSMFNIGRQAPKSPEVRLLEKVILHLEYIDKKLDFIDKKLTALGNLILETHKNVMHTFQSVFKELDLLGEKLDDITNITWDNLSSGYRNCSNIALHNFNPKKYSDLIERYEYFRENNTFECVSALNKTVSRILLVDNTNFDDVLYVHMINAKNEYLRKYIFNPVYDFHNLTFGDDKLVLLATSLTDPLISKRSEALKGIIRLMRNDSKAAKKIRNSTNIFKDDRMLSTTAVCHVAKYYLSLSVYLDSGDIHFKPKPIEKILNRRSINFEIKTNGLTVLLDILNATILQQMFISGVPLIDSLDATIKNKASQRAYDLAIMILENNPTAALNFAISQLYKNLNIAQTQWVVNPHDNFRREVSISKWSEFISVYDKEKAKNRPTEGENAPFYPNSKDFQLKLHQNGDVIFEVNVFDKHGKKDHIIKIPIVIPQNINDGRMIVSPHVEELRVLRERVSDQLTEIEFLRKLDTDTEEEKNTYRYLIIS